jgi:hypothetical protein
MHQEVFIRRSLTPLIPKKEKGPKPKTSQDRKLRHGIYHPSIHHTIHSVFTPPKTVDSFLRPMIIYTNNPSSSHSETHFHRPLLSPALSGNCLSSVLNAKVRGVYGCAGVALTVGRTRFISHSRSELSDKGECLVCMSSMPIFDAARWDAVGIRDQMPRRRLRKNVALRGC